jgi:hypothetical protein
MSALGKKGFLYVGPLLVNDLIGEEEEYEIIGCNYHHYKTSYKERIVIAFHSRMRRFKY